MGYRNFLILIIGLYTSHMSMSQEPYTAAEKLFGSNPKKAIDGGYEIKVTINGYKDTSCYLAYHYGEKQFMKDTVNLINGTATFKGDEHLPGGIYMFVLDAKEGQYFEFVVNESKIHIETEYKRYLEKMIVHHSEENKLFFGYINFISEKRKEQNRIKGELKNSKKGSKKHKELDNKIKELDKEVEAYTNNIINNNSELLYAKILKAMKRINVPEPPKNEKGELIDSSFSYKYYKQHFFDYFDLADDRMLRTPIFKDKLKEYMTRLTPQNPDSLNVMADYLLNKTESNDEVFKYLLIYFLNKYADSKIMGMDAIYVHLVENYYAKNKATWLDSVQLYRITDRASKLKYTLIGKTAPRIVLPDTSNRQQDLYRIGADYTLLYFWDPTCGHCKKVTPKLKKVYDSLRTENISVEVYAVCTEIERDKWITYIKENELGWVNVADFEVKHPFRYYYDIQATPKLYILDRNREIIAKRLGVEQIPDFLTNYGKMVAKRKEK